MGEVVGKQICVFGRRVTRKILKEVKIHILS
jgi:hypothetical protein